MKPLPLLAATLSIGMIAACDSVAERQAEATEDRIEDQADVSAAAAGAASAALGLTETQLLEADLVGADGADLGDVEQVRRNASGAVEGFLVELEGDGPNHYVAIELDGLTTRVEGNKTDLQTDMTAAQLSAMPEATR